MSRPSTRPAAGLAGAELKTDPLVGKVLADRYRLDALLGEGGMGKVYAGEHVLMRKKLAVKILHKELTSVPEVVKRFEREAMAAANIDHPNVAAATDFGKLPDGSVFLVLEFVQGRNLRDEIAKGPMNVERALIISRQIAGALAAAHTLDIVHRDLKPENVMLVDKAGDPDFVKVLDFGIAKVPLADKHEQKGGKPITKVGMVFGTPEYMAPEQALGQGVDGRADLYALGVITYEMVAGVRPFSSKSPVGILGQQLSKAPPTVADRVPGLFVPPSVEQLLQKLLARETGERFQKATDVVSAMDALLGPSPNTRPRMFTMAAGTPSGPEPAPLPAASIPDLEAPVPVLMPPSALGVSGQTLASFPSSPENQAPSAPRLPMPSVPREPSLVAQELSMSDILEADLDADASSPQSAPNPVARPGPESITGARREREKLREAWDDILRSGRAQLRRVYAFADDRRTRLPVKIQRPLARLTTPQLVGIFTIAVVGLFLGTSIALVAVIGSRSKAKPVASATPIASVPEIASTEPEGPSYPHATDDELAEAKSAGRAKVSELGEKYPQDKRIPVTLLKMEVEEQRFKDVIATVKKLIDSDAKMTKDPDIADALFRAAQRDDVSRQAFDLLEGPMGSAGADIIYNLAFEDKVKPQTKARAGKWLETTNFGRASSPALYALVELRKASSCQIRYNLLKKAKNVGDERVLDLLKSYEKKDGCGKAGDEDCNGCMRSDNELGDAIKEIETRVKK